MFVIIIFIVLILMVMFVAYNQRQTDTDTETESKKEKEKGNGDKKENENKKGNESQPQPELNEIIEPNQSGQSTKPIEPIEPIQLTIPESKESKENNKIGGKEEIDSHKPIETIQTIEPIEPIEPETVEDGLDIKQIIRKFDPDRFGFGQNVIDQDNTFSDLAEQYIYNIYQKQLIKQRLPIGSLVFTILPIKKNEIGVFQMAGYYLQPAINVKNPITQQYQNNFGYGSGISCPEIVNKNIIGTKDQNIPYNSMQIIDNQEVQTIPKIQRTFEQTTVPVYKQNVDYVSHGNHGSWRESKYISENTFTGTSVQHIINQIGSIEENDQIKIDIRNESNVFFFYMIIGYVNDKQNIRDPDDPDQHYIDDIEIWKL